MLIVVGCAQSDNGLVPVSGVVRIDGQPVRAGTVRFVPASGRPLSGTIRPDGTFELASENFQQIRQVGAPPGQYRIQISAPKVVNDQLVEWKVPQRYADFRTSGLQTAIDHSHEEVAIDLTWHDTSADSENGSLKKGDEGPDAARAEAAERKTEAPRL
jgi:hypothetical protein